MKKPGFWVIGGGILQIRMILEARELGYKVYVTDGADTAPGFELADRHAILDTYDQTGHKLLARRWLGEGTNIVGVATCGADVAPTVAAVARVLNLPGHPIGVAEMTHNKYLVRYLLHNAGLSHVQPRWRIVHNAGTAAMLHSYLKSIFDEWGGLVMKPLKQRASRGITICHNEYDLQVGLTNLQPYVSFGDDFLIESILTGTEHSAEIIFKSATEPIYFNIVDRVFDYMGGFPIEMGHISPSELASEQWDECLELVLTTACALGIHWGPFKCDVIWTQDGPKILECTARLSGGFDCQETIYMSNRRPIRQLIQLCTTGLVEEEYRLNYSDGQFAGLHGACKAAFPPPGTIQALPRDTLLRGMGGVRKVIFASKVGDVIEPYRNCAQRPAFVICAGVTPLDAWTRATASADMLAEGFEMA